MPAPQQAQVASCKVTRSSIDRGMAARSPNTAKHFLYALRGLFQWGMKAQHCAHDPTAGLKPIQQHSDGHPVWPEAWCRQHEAYWPLGTQQRLDYDLLPVWRRWPLSMTLHRSSGVPSLLLSRCYVTASALAQPLWRLRRYQSSPLLECVKRAGRINAWRSSDKLDHPLELDGGEPCSSLPLTSRPLRRLASLFRKHPCCAPTR